MPTGLTLGVETLGAAARRAAVGTANHTGGTAEVLDAATAYANRRWFRGDTHAGLKPFHRAPEAVPAQTGQAPRTAEEALDTWTRENAFLAWKHDPTSTPSPRIGGGVSTPYQDFVRSSAPIPTAPATSEADEFIRWRSANATTQPAAQSGGGLTLYQRFKRAFSRS